MTGFVSAVVRTGYVTFHAINSRFTPYGIRIQLFLMYIVLIYILKDTYTELRLRNKAEDIIAF